MMAEKQRRQRLTSLVVQCVASPQASISDPFSFSPDNAKYSPAKMSREDKYNLYFINSTNMGHFNEGECFLKENMLLQ